MWRPAQPHRAPGLAPSSLDWREMYSPQLVEGCWVKRIPGRLVGWGWEAGILPEDLWGLGEWHVQWLVPGLCPQVTQGRTKQAGLCPRACPSLACDADGGQWPLAEGKSPARSSGLFICMKQGY